MGKITFSPKKKSNIEEIDTTKIINTDNKPVTSTDDIIDELTKKDESKKDKIKEEVDIEKVDNSIRNPTIIKTDNKDKKEILTKKIDPKELLPKIAKEAKPVKVQEVKTGLNWTRAGLYLTALAIIGIIFFSQMANDINPAFVLLIWLFGMLCFLPLGFIGGWLFLDPYMRCKLMRRFRGRNYGIINFLHKGGQRIVTRIKNLDDDVIVSEGRLWLIDKEGIHYISKDGEKVLHKVINPENVKTLPANVPCLFLDPESMIPIKFIDTPTKTNPQQAGAVVQGYINNQVLKNAMFKKGGTIIYIIIMILAGITMVISFQLYTWIEEMSKTLPALQNQINQLSNMLAEFNPPIPTIFHNFWSWLIW